MSESAHPRDLLGRPLHDLRISVIDACNFRCPYCMPADVFGSAYRFLPPEELLSFAEIERLARLFVGLGAVKLKLTGGEPLLRPWLPELVRALSAIEGVEEVALITNGSRLGPLARALRASGLDRLTVSLDSLDPETFAALNGRAQRLETVLSGIEEARAAGFEAIKLNMVVMRGVNDRETVDMVRRFRGTGHVVRFIELMDVGNRNGWRLDQVVPSREIRDRIAAEFPLAALPARYPGEVARRYRLVDGSGEVGFISSVSEPFCGSCSRARLSADGKLYTCLFARSGFDLRALLRSGARDEEIESALRRLWSRRADRYSEERFERRQAGEEKVEMYYIGG